MVSRGKIFSLKQKAATGKILWQMALRNLYRNSRRSILTGLAACVGMIGVMFSMGLTNGLGRGMISSATQWGLGHVQVRPAGYDRSRKLGMLLEHPDLVRSRLSDLTHRKSEVQSAGRLEREGLIRVGGKTQGTLVLGIEPLAERRIGAVAKNVVEGAFFTEDSVSDRRIGIYPVLIGRAAAVRLEVRSQETIVLWISNIKGDSTAVRARVVGIYAGPAPAIEKGLVFMRRTDLADLFAADRAAVGYFVLEAGDIALAAELKSQLLIELATIQGVEVMTWAEHEPMLPRMLEISDQFSWIAYLVLMFGFALILFEAIMMSVYERTREIGVLRALGAKGTFVFWMVQVESIVVSMLGACCGALFGGAVILYFYTFGLPLGGFSRGMELLGRAAVGNVQPFVRPGDLLVGFSIALLTALIAGVYPALRAVRLTPVQAMRR